MRETYRITITLEESVVIARAIGREIAAVEKAITERSKFNDSPSHLQTLYDVRKSYVDMQRRFENLTSQKQKKRRLATARARKP